MARVAQRRSGSHPRIAPGHPAIADKVLRRRNAVPPTWEWRGWRSVGADLIRESRRDARLSRTRSAPTEEKYRASRQPVGAGPARDFARRARSYRGIAPGRPAIADKVRYPLRTGTAPRRMVLSEAIPIATTAWVSQAQPILRKAARRSRVGVSASAAMSPGAAQLSDLPCTSSFMRVRPMWRTSVPRTR